MILRMHGHCHTEPVKNFARPDIPLGVFVMRDCSDYAKRFPHLGIAVRRPEAGDVAGDIVGVIMDRQVGGLEDRDRPGAADAGTAAISGLAWARYLGPVKGAVTFPIDVSAYDAAPSGDQLGLVLGGPHAGAVRRFEPGDIPVGAAVAVEDEFLLVRLLAPYRNVTGGLGLA